MDADRPHGSPQLRELRIEVPDRDPVSGLFLGSPDPGALLVLAHGAGAGMRHPFMESIAARLAGMDVATLRYQFPYMEAGKKRPDRPPVAHATVRAAVAAASEHGAAAPVFAGGKSFGGRMTSQAVSESPPPDVRGLVFLGFPLHPAGRPGSDRADHLDAITVPMLFVQGTRDALADLDLLRPVLDRLGDRARIHEVADGDHSFHVPRRSGRTDEEVMNEIAAVVAAFVTAPDR